jgi:hypothetical protein
MSLLPNMNDPIDQKAFALAVEAVIGTALLGNSENPKNQEPAHDWIVTALNGSDPSNAILARAMYFVSRLLDGPKSV